MLAARRTLPYLGEHPTIMFPSTAGTWRDPNNFGRDWRRVRAEPGVAEVTTHNFPKSVATLIDDRGFSARIGADQLRLARPSMTQDLYMARCKLHTQVAEALDEAISGALTLHEQAAPPQKAL
jgi:integrase